MELRIIGKRGQSLDVTIPTKIVALLGLKRGDYLAWDIAVDKKVHISKGALNKGASP